jgi:hypothetical protein
MRAATGDTSIAASPAGEEPGARSAAAPALGTSRVLSGGSIIAIAVARTVRDGEPA